MSFGFWYLVVRHCCKGISNGAALLQGHFEKSAVFFDVSQRPIAKPSTGLQLLTMPLNRLPSSCDKPRGSETETVQHGRKNSYSLSPDTFFDEKCLKYCRRVKYRNKAKIEDLDKDDSIILKWNPL
jgi:hypothetical protein